MVERKTIKMVEKERGVVVVAIVMKWNKERISKKKRRKKLYIARKEERSK